MNIVVTGGAGFIGSSLSNKLHKLGHRVSVIDNLCKGKKENINRNINLYKEDITSKTFTTLLNKIYPNIIYHFAAQTSVSSSNKNPEADFRINLIATQKLLKSAAKMKVKKIIFASSAAIYGDSDVLPVLEDTPKNPLSIYGITKLTSEYLFKINFNYHNIPYTILRYANVYGEHQDSSAEGGVVAIFINNALNGQEIRINGNGKQTRDFIHISDITNANIYALHQQVIGEFNISTGRQSSVNRLYNIISDLTGNKTKKSYVPLLYPEVTSSQLSSQKFHAQTGWSADVDVENGLKETFNFFKNI